MGRLASLLACLLASCLRLRTKSAMSYPIDWLTYVSKLTSRSNGFRLRAGSVSSQARAIFDGKWLPRIFVAFEH